MTGRYPKVTFETAEVDFLASPGARSKVMSAVVESITPDEWLVLSSCQSGHATCFSGRLPEFSSRGGGCPVERVPGCFRLQLVHG